MGRRLGLRDSSIYAPLWVVDFPLLEWDDETQRFYAKHHPFTAPKPEDIRYMESDPLRVRANAYDLVINGTEIGGGSIRIHDPETQSLMFRTSCSMPSVTALRLTEGLHSGLTGGRQLWVALIPFVITLPSRKTTRPAT